MTESKYQSVQGKGKRNVSQRQSSQVLADNRQPLQMQVNNTGLPDNLKSGMENLSGVNLDHVNVHYNSLKPATVQAHAYAQGNDIHVGPGQEKHLPHELGHVVQQMQGRVKPTTSVGGMAVNDHPGLESEATRMGDMALQRMAASQSAEFKGAPLVQAQVTQLAEGDDKKDKSTTDKIDELTENLTGPLDPADKPKVKLSDFDEELLAGKHQISFWDKMKYGARTSSAGLLIGHLYNKYKGTENVFSYTDIATMVPTLAAPGIQGAIYRKLAGTSLTPYPKDLTHDWVEKYSEISSATGKKKTHYFKLSSELATILSSATAIASLVLLLTKERHKSDPGDAWYESVLSWTNIAAGVASMALDFIIYLTNKGYQLDDSILAKEKNLAQAINHLERQREKYTMLASMTVGNASVLTSVLNVSGVKDKGYIVEGIDYALGALSDFGTPVGVSAATKKELTKYYQEMVSILSGMQVASKKIGIEMKAEQSLPNDSQRQIIDDNSSIGSSRTEQEQANSEIAVKVENSETEKKSVDGEKLIDIEL